MEIGAIIADQIKNSDNAFLNSALYRYRKEKKQEYYEHKKKVEQGARKDAEIKADAEEKK